LIDEVFKNTEGATITDADIDVLLAQGEERTKAASEKLKKDMSKIIGSTVTLEDLLKSDNSKYLVPEDEGGSSGGLSASLFIPLPEREKKQTGYNESATAQLMSTKASRPSGPKLIKLPVMHDFQFYSKARLEELVAKENELMLRRRELQKLLTEKRSKESNEKRMFVRARVKELMGSRALEVMDEDEPSGEGVKGAGLSANSALSPASPSQNASSIGTGGDEGTLTQSEATAQAEKEWVIRLGEEPESVKLEAEIKASEFPDCDAIEKATLLSFPHAFPTWNRKDLRFYHLACEKHGRANVEAVSAEVTAATDKSVEEITRYHAVHWERVGELSDAARVIERVEKGEFKLKKSKALESVVAEKVAKYADPFRSLQIPYGSDKRATLRGFTEEEDRFLVCMLNALGFGAWDALKCEIRCAEAFRFDFFFKSRSTADLARRCDTLIRLLEKEAVDQGTAAGKEIEAAGGTRQGRGKGKSDPAGGDAEGYELGAGGKKAEGKVAKKRKRASKGTAAPPGGEEDLDVDSVDGKVGHMEE